MTSDELRSKLERTGENHTRISKAYFEENFHRTGDSIEFSFGGWDGKSYSGESRRASVWQCVIPGAEMERFVKVGKSIHMIDEDQTHMVTELATGKKHYAVGWVIDVARA